VLAAKLGKKEEDILKEELIKDKINVRIQAPADVLTGPFEKVVTETFVYAAATDARAK